MNHKTLDNIAEERLPDYQIPFRDDGKIIVVESMGKIAVPMPSKLAEVLEVQVREGMGILDYTQSLKSLNDGKFLDALVEETRRLIAGEKELFDLSREDVTGGTKDFEIGGKVYHLHFVGQTYQGIKSLTIKDETFITRQKRVAEERQRALEELARVGEYAAELTHDIKNLLTSMKAGCKVLSLEMREGEKYPSVLESFGELIGRLEKVVMSPLDFLRRDKYELVPVNVNRLLLESALNIEAIDKRLKVNYKTGNDAYVAMNRSRFGEKILLNLINNSIEAGSTEIMLSYEVKEPYVFLRISDNGKAEIPDEIFERMFEPM
ncbi:MAG TPA: HAMP domain-containing sensor histidine kinase, partial [Candidatus Nanoarchaeia archaeon]|nr:HAMP domain-containing sensor histidine kinase [Candidatus Nanoarchaeia archaeon]